MTKTTLATGADRQTAMSQWRVVDASGQILGRMAAQIAQVLMGKHRPDYTPHMLVGEGVIVINAEKVQVSGEKRETREYTYWTGYPNAATAPYTDPVPNWGNTRYMMVKLKPKQP